VEIQEDNSHTMNCFALGNLTMNKLFYMITLKFSLNLTK